MTRNLSGLGSVLIVENEVLQSEMLADTLFDAGASEVRSCVSAAEALVQFGNFCPAILILDVRLADLEDGWLVADLARQVLARMPLVVFATGAPERIPARIANLGILAIKPYEVGELVETIRNLVRPPIEPLVRTLVRCRLHG